MTDHYKEYIVNTNDVSRTKREVKDKLGEAAGVLLVVSTSDHGRASTREVTFVPSEVPPSGFIFSRGMILPDNTEASIKSEDNDKYLVLVAALDNEHSQNS
jgi:hypothetical protein